MSTTICPFEKSRRDAVLPEQNRLYMRRVGHHDDHDIGLCCDFLARFADHAAGGDQFRCNRRDIVQEQAMAGSLKMAGHGTPHGAEADKADIDHFELSPCRFLVSGQVSSVSAACHPRPSTVVVLGLYSHPIQPR